MDLALPAKSDFCRCNESPLLVLSSFRYTRACASSLCVRIRRGGCSQTGAERGAEALVLVRACCGLVPAGYEVSAIDDSPSLK
eukprot:SAG22_NODE_2112_length_2995_cov_1.672307_3_plen_83_part_00